MSRLLRTSIPCICGPSYGRIHWSTATHFHRIERSKTQTWSFKVNKMAQGNGLIQAVSHYSVDETVRRLQEVLAEKGLKVFALIDHSGEAEKAGLKMRPTKVLIFGSPKGGTPLMVAAPSLAIDLPMKALVAEDAAGKVTVTYNDPAYLKERHGVPEELIKNLAGAGVVIAKAVE
jgi:uncharacterized protein (DUF302 family)